MDLPVNHDLPNIETLAEMLDGGELRIPIQESICRLPLNYDDLMNSSKYVKALVLNAILGNKATPTKESIVEYFKAHLIASGAQHVDIFAEFFWDILAQERHNIEDMALDRGEYYDIKYYQDTVTSTFVRIFKSLDTEKTQPEEN